MKSKFIIIMTFLISGFNAHADDKWQFKLEPYIMFTNISGDADNGRASGIDLNLDFSTILENLDMAAMLKAEALHHSGWGATIDYGFMDLGQKKSSQRNGYLDASLRQGIFEALGFYRYQLSNGYIDYMAGIRWWDNDISITLDSAIFPGSLNTDIEEDWVDVIGAIRWRQRLQENLYFTGRVDIGGFGVESDFTSGLELGVDYELSETMTLVVKYRGIWVDYDNEEPINTPERFSYDTVTHGPILALAFDF
jgi:hypothetical protein